MCSVLSNHQAPGRDIARKCASMERVKHILCGGYWPHDCKHWVQASPAVRQLLQTRPIVQTHLGWSLLCQPNIGHVKLQPIKKRQTHAWSDTLGGHARIQPTPAPPCDSTWHHASWLISRSGDRCSMGSWVCAHSEHVFPACYCLIKYSLMLHAMIEIPFWSH